MKDFLLKRSINDRRDNIRNFSIPYDILMRDATTEERKIVVFLGDNFRDLPGTDIKEATRISNLCLDYVRRECQDCDLYYKPHPRVNVPGKEDPDLLDLSGFKIERRAVAELFYVKNIKKIKYVFATCSMGSISAYNMGLNSYSFLNIIGKTFAPTTFKGKQDIFKDMPPNFFINDLNQLLKENRKHFDNDGTLEKNIHEILYQKKGHLWILLGDISALADIIIVTRLVRKIDPQRKVNLIGVRHHRWDVIPSDSIREYFNDIFFVPRVFYSLRPIKIFRAVKAALAIKKFSIQPEDIILENPGLDFASDCFVSYFRNNIRIVMFSQDTFKISCEEQKYSRAIFRTRPGATFFNLILEPILGIERTRWLEDKRRIFNVNRYVRPMNDIFDYIWLF